MCLNSVGFFVFAARTEGPHGAWARQSTHPKLGRPPPHNAEHPSAVCMTSALTHRRWMRRRRGGWRRSRHPARSHGQPRPGLGNDPRRVRRERPKESSPTNHHRRLITRCFDFVCSSVCTLPPPHTHTHTHTTTTTTTTRAGGWCGGLAWLCMRVPQRGWGPALTKASFPPTQAQQPG